jgi:general secretion pathway protein M
MKMPNLAGPAGGPDSTSALRVWWRALPDRQRNLLILAGVVVVGALLWWVALQPALQTVRSAPAELDNLEGQLQTMQRLAAEATELRATPPVNREQAAVALTAATDRLGEKARLNLQGDRAVLTLNGAGTAAVRDWLAEARSGARARPVEASLMRGTQGYSGTIVLAIGGAP